MQPILSSPKSTNFQFLSSIYAIFIENVSKIILQKLNKVHFWSPINNFAYIYKDKVDTRTLRY